MTENDEYTARWWNEQIVTAEKLADREWRDNGDKITKKYLDKRALDVKSAFNYNIFWANTGILKAALYARPPRPLVSRAFEDPQDQPARVGGEILQRILSHDLQKDHSDIDEAFRLAIQDNLIPGLGQVWHRYEADFEPVVIPAVTDPETGMELASAIESERVTDERAICDYVYWRDFIWGPCRVWAECPWVARRVYMSKSQFIKKFGEEVAEKLKGKFSVPVRGSDSAKKQFTKTKVAVFEIWCKETKKVYFTTAECDEILQETDDPLKLEKFFPCPEPLITTNSTDALTPRADYTMMQDQYDELNELNTRIFLIEKALRVIGVYDQSAPELQRMLTESTENDMIAVKNWGNLAEKGGLKGSVDWFPLDTVAKVLGELSVQKSARLQEIYELSGISDIMRGVTEARETAAAQKLKAQYSSVRLQYRSGEVARFAEESLRIRSEIICSFQPDTIKKKSQIEITDDAQLAAPAIELLKNKSVMPYRIRIAEESLALPDYNSERDTRVEFLTSTGQFLSQIMPMIQEKPETAPYMMKILQWVTAGFRGAQQMEGVLNQAYQAMMQAAQQPQPEKPDPMVQLEQMKQAGETERAKFEAQWKTQLEVIEANSDQRVASIKAAADLQIAQLKEGMQQQSEALRAQIDSLSEFIKLQLGTAKLQADKEKAEAADVDEGE